MPTPITPNELFKLIQAGRFVEARRSKVSQNFTWGEVLIHRTDDSIKRFFTLDHANVAATYAQRVEWIRKFLGDRPITVTSWWRDRDSNAKVGGRPASRHLLGDGVDFTVVGLTPKQVQAMLDPVWNGGLGYGKTFTHSDGRPTRARFNYS